MFKFKKEITVKDSITGFQGVITARVDYISESSQYYVEAAQESKWIVEGRLEVVGAEAGEDVSDISL